MSLDLEAIKAREAFREWQAKLAKQHGPTTASDPPKDNDVVDLIREVESLRIANHDLRNELNQRAMADAEREMDIKGAKVDA